MQQAQVEIIERKLAGDRGTYFRGTARVRLQRLHFGDQCSRELDRKIVESLKDTFEIEGCLRLEPSHHIPALIDRQTLELAIKSSPGVSAAALLDNPKKLPPELKLNCSLECLHGRHRLQAAREILLPKDKWWTVDLYLTDISLDLRQELSDEYSNSINFSDGEIYQKLRQYVLYPGSMTMFAEKRWWARLSKDKRKELTQFFKHGRFTAAFDALLVIPALWVDLRIGMLHKLISMRCDEELLHYLKHILKTWLKILGEDLELMRITDPLTVEAVQLRAPGSSPADLAELEPSFSNGKLFHGVQNQEDRQSIWKNLQEVQWLIPSLYSFFEDFKYLNPLATILKRLFGKTKDTVYQAMGHIFSGCNQNDGEYIVQEAKRVFRPESGNLSDQFEFGYRQVWLYSWRHFTELIEECPRKEDGHPTPVPQEPDEVLWYEFAVLASELGFESEQIRQLKSGNPDREVARKSLLRARDPRYFKYDEAVFECFVDQLVDMFRAAIDILPTYIKPPLLVHGPGESLQRRCGRVFQKAYEDDRDFLFLDVLYDPRKGEGEGASSFYVRMSVYFAFFGDPQNTSPGVRPSTPPRTTADPPVAQPEKRPRNLDRNRSRSASPTRPSHRSSRRRERSASSHRERRRSQRADTGNNAPPETPDNERSSQSIAHSPQAAEPMALDRIEISEGALDTRVPNQEQAMTLMSPRVLVRLWQNNLFEDQQTILAMDRSEVERFASKQLRKQMCLFNTLGRALTSKNCFDAIRGTQTLILVPDDQLDISRQLIAST